ncbi:Probable licABCH operon regulator [Gemella morbillorum]|uniref:BglG family transcription antiterminator n=1 Tax=Gemella morbillorum TaxID=29391 RepID=UPI000DA391DF|nr:PTS sugar transporter subunit IIA [Gemella morbillorum]UBH80526.1 PTS sugar transporter subunit IIA [Gemella morbillorum]SQH55924.1 Probable licABCH operon regulator [Gemella morbillorum]
MFNEREKFILQILLKNIGEALSIKEIAKATKIKERTLYREIKNLEDSLQRLGIELVKEKSRYILKGNVSSLDSSLFETNFEDYAYSTETRLTLILCFLILNEDTSIKDISEKLMLSYNTVASTITTIEKILFDYKLTLIRKKGQGIEIEGKEVDRRVLLISLLCNEISDEEFFTRLNNRDILSSNPFIKFLNFDLIKKVFYENKHLDVFNLYTDSSIKKILISLNVVFLRISYTTEIKENFTAQEYNSIISLLNASKEIVDFDITEDIIQFLIKILKTCRLIEQLSYFNDKYSYTLVYKINLLIKYVSEKMNIDFTQDTNLSSGLIAHVESAIKRHQMNLTEENDELLEFVLKNYNELYLIIKSELLVVFDEINFNSTELSYIVIHFASSFEQIYRKNFIRALVICASGIGSSKILGSQIRKNIPEIKNLEYTIPSKVTKSLVNNYDVVISTIELEQDIDYLLIPTILKEKDISLIQERILASRSFKRNDFVKSEDSFNIDKLGSACQIILKNTEYIVADNTKNNEEILDNIFENSALVINNKEEIVDSLLDRHNKSSVVIPNTDIALFHTLDKELAEPFIIICSLNNVLAMKDAMGEEQRVEYFIIMVSPNEQEYTELLSQISIAILDDKIFGEALTSKNKNFILTKVELILKNYILQL